MTKSNYEKNSITLPGAVAMGTGVMIGAGIFALTGQIAELAGPIFPLSFVVGAIVLREEIDAKGWVLLTAFALDAVVLAAFSAMKWQSDPPIVVIAVVGMALVFLFVRVFLARIPVREGAHDHH